MSRFLESDPPGGGPSPFGGSLWANRSVPANRHGWCCHPSPVPVRTPAGRQVVARFALTTKQRPGCPLERNDSTGRRDEETVMELEPEVVERTFEACYDPAGDVRVDGIMLPARFDKRKLADHAELIAALLSELPDQFKTSGGGGWSFLNACMDRRGNQWTGMHSTMDKLFMLGLAIGMVEPLLPRDVWPTLPGGMPYYLVKDAAQAVDQ
jgi:hypothetical protein